MLTRTIKKAGIICRNKGTLATSESHNVDIKTNERGELKPLPLRFDGKHQPTHDMYIDTAKLAELSDFSERIQSASN